MFLLATSFSGDLSKWDVSRVIDISCMFSETYFNGDLSKWDVSSVTDMTRMFFSTSFNGDVSKWDVSSVTSMDHMFFKAVSFNQKLGVNWANSKATKRNMFTCSSGSILRAVRTKATTFSSKSELEDAVDAYLKSSPKGDGLIAQWDVSRVRDMSGVFY